MTDSKTRTVASFHRRRRVGPLLALGALAIGVAACQPQIDTRGNLPHPEFVQELQPGVHDRDQVARLLGTPSTIGTFDDKKWYYISKRTETIAFLKPEVVDQQVLVVEFDETGVVSDVKLYDHEDGREIEPVARETPTAGQELTLLKQLLGNLGRFNNRE